MDMLEEHMYCSEQINIPATLPYILKQYNKAAIRTQPYDLLRWTVAYFKAMAEGETPPIKPRFEHIPVDSPPGLTPGYLRLLLRQLGHRKTVSIGKLFDKWYGIALDESTLTQLLSVGNFDAEVEWLHFVAIAAGHLTKSLGETMILLCELLTREPEGGSAMVACDAFVDLYTYLATLDCGLPVDACETPSSSTLDFDLRDSQTLATPNSDAERGISNRAPSVESVGEEPPLHPLVYFRPAQRDSEGEMIDTASVIVDERGIADAVEARVLGKDPLIYSDKHAVMQDDETQTEVKPNETEEDVQQKQVVHVPGIGPVLPEEQINSVVKYVQWWAERQEGMVMPRNLRHFLCPPLDQLPVPEPCTTKYHYPNTNTYH